ncbi:bifunctional metallophosphatase/5'-nucleotidase [Myxococcus landrumensis]|uniref:Bifunctional metallophosphatase/5'-nucleotidase n=1 Tax=Myxococcus landrumensis TaxID=2813577 RepID=A0ABX7NFU5_9BACT|nr:bifunctional metallophosphatase/5'-nucleotidase [Myxococcus landrumus]QSQ17685.1 bifunctional metallophosphatase/5'-nucleotidase [Myxococcus landrumus]
MPQATPRSSPSVFLLAGAFVTGMFLFTHVGCGGDECQDAADCREDQGPPASNTEWVCDHKRCELHPVQVPSSDSGTDAGTPDSGAPDSGRPDSGTPDAGRPDSGTPDSGPTTVSVQVLAFNDFHGQLEAPSGQILTGVNPDGGAVRVSAGGVTYFARHIAALRATNPNTVVVAAGDLIGASPLLSALFHDEPTIEAMNMIGLDLVAVGNHEFDEGSAELLRMQSGGCHPVDGCLDGDGFPGAKFKFLAANVATGVDRTLFPRYDVREFDGVKVAFIGMTLENTPESVISTGVAGLTFKDEVQTVNALVPELRQQGIEAIVVVVHQGGIPAWGSLVNECKGEGAGGIIAGAIVGLTKGLDDAVDVVVSGHTHQAYNCVIDGKIVTSASSMGQLVTDIDLTLSKATGDVVEARANNVIVTRDVQEVGAVKDLVTKYQDLVTPRANRVIGWVAQTLRSQTDSAGQSTLGFVIADSQLEATKPANMGGAQVAFMNPGGVRADIAQGEVTYGEAFTTQPFGNSLVTMTLTGAQIDQLLELQWRSSGATLMLLPSAGFTYSFSAAAPVGSRVDPASIKFNGVPVSLTAEYRVTANSYLAAGSDGFPVFTEGKNRLGGALDSDALEEYLKAHSSQASPLPAPALNRITRLP